MKISEVCTRTGLTERTVRFYVEKGLLSKPARYVNGRNLRDYDEEDIRILNNISALRKAGFSIQDILDMQSDPDHINTIITAHTKKLEQKCKEYEGIIKDLKDINARGRVSLNKLADLLSNHSEIRPQDIELRWPEETIYPQQKGTGLPRFLKAVAVAISLIGILAGVNLYINYHKPINTIFLVSDVTFHNKWFDNELLVTISSDTEVPVYHDNYFAYPRTLQITSSQVYDAIITEEITYPSVTVILEVPYGEAQKNGWINEGDISTLKVEEILVSPVLTRKYGTIVSVDGD